MGKSYMTSRKISWARFHRHACLQKADEMKKYTHSSKNERCIYIYMFVYVVHRMLIKQTHVVYSLYSNDMISHPHYVPHHIPIIFGDTSHDTRYPEGCSDNSFY